MKSSARAWGVSFLCATACSDVDGNVYECQGKDAGFECGYDGVDGAGGQRTCDARVDTGDITGLAIAGEIPWCVEAE